MLEVTGLCAEVGTFFLKDITFEVQDGEYFVLLGSTGAGKTVLLESIAGLKSVSHGQVSINGRDVTSLSLEQRRIGIAYQDYTLYRHLSVRDNISFRLLWRDTTGQEIEKGMDRAIKLLGIQNLLKKRAMSLSGGETQKICLARAIAIKPDLLLLDEPLSSVDAESREAAEKQLREIHNQLQLTTIHVTHNIEEAIALGDRIAVMQEGEIRQIGTPGQIFRHPDSEYVARFFMTRNIFEGEVQDGVFHVKDTKLAVATVLQGKRHASIRPEDIWLSREPQNADALNSIEGTVIRIADRGSVVYVTVNVPPEFTCLILPRSLEEMNLMEEQKVFIIFKASAVNVF